jgi:hypothetical protein
MRWSRSEDEQFQSLVESGASIDDIANSLMRTAAQLRARAYHLGFPLKWFRRTTASK